MAKLLIIAEKPSLAKNIASAIGGMNWKTVNPKTHSGYYENRSFILTSAFGHLFELMNAEDYNPDYKEWDIDVLPIIPNPFIYKLKDDAGVISQFKLIKDLLADSSVRGVINAGDSDREGEIIIRNILREGGNTKPVYRLWMPDQTAQTIRTELSKMDPDWKYDNLADEGYARTVVDWLYGINLTRLVSKKTDKLMRIGRVTSPIVVAICERERAIRNFVPEKYYVAQHNEQGLKLTSSKKHDRMSKCVTQCDHYNTLPLWVKDKTVTKKILPRPKLFALSDLQGVMGKKYGFSPKMTLDILQSLYDEGYASYPRTNSQYMAVAEKDKAKDIITAIKKAFPGKFNGIQFRDSKQIFDDSKIESHSGITPTYKIPNINNLTDDAKKVYAIILARFAAVFCTEDYMVDRTTLTITNGEEDFTLTGDVVLTKGYTVYEESTKKDVILPPLKKGDKIHPNFVPETKETTPPDHYTAETLNSYLKNPYSKEEKKELSDDEENKEVISDVELGTEATRAGLIDGAIKSGYITLSKNRYGITPLGEYYTDAVAALGVDMTKERTLELSKLLKKVYRSEETIYSVIDSAKADLTDICTQTKKVKYEKPASATSTQSASGFCKCPKCGEEIVKNSVAYSCKNRDCGCVIFIKDKFFACFKKKMTDTIAKSLFTKGYADVKGLISAKTGKAFNARIHVDFSDKYPKYNLEFEK